MSDDHGQPPHAPARAGRARGRPPGEHRPGERPGRRHSLVLTVLAILTFVALVPVVLMGYHLTRNLTDDLAASQKEVQLDKGTTIAEEIARHVRDHFARLAVTADAFVDLARPSGERTPVDERALVRFLDRYVDSEGVLEIRYVPADDSQALLRVHSPHFDPEVIRDDLEPHVAEAVRKGRRGSQHLSNPFLPSGRSLHPLAVLSVPVRFDDGPSHAEGRPVLVAVISLASIQRLVQRVGDSTLGYTVFVVDNELRPFAHTQFTRVLDRQPLAESPLVQEFQRHGLSAASLEFTEPGPGGGRRMIGTYVPALRDDHRWGVFVQVDREVGFSQVRHVRMTTLWWGLLAFGLAVVAGLAFSSRITGPIHRLTESTRRIATGEYGKHVRVRSNNEIGMLADNFNQMSEEIRSTIDSLREQKELNDQLFLSSIRSLAAAIDARDPYTRGHSERVTRYSRIIARQLHLPPDQVRSVEIGALLHDVGKIGIEDRILRKPAALTPEEFELMKTHPEKGGDIMAPIAFLRDATEVIIHHHERWDGAGYPSGLGGEEIPLGARIVNVADTFDAMTTNRPYQRAMTFAVAARKIGEFAGKACDPKVVAAFQRAFEEGLFGQVEPAARAATS